MQAERLWKRKNRMALWVIAAIIAFWARGVIALAAWQLFLGMLAAFAALPLAKRLEKRFSPGAAAGAALACLGTGMLGILLLLTPSLISQGRQLMEMLPALMEALGRMTQRLQGWAAQNGIQADGEILLARLQDGLGAAAPAVVERLSGAAGNLGLWMLAPVFGFYFLRDRRKIAEGLLLLVPGKRRGMIVRILREMRREVAGYLRGQLLISAAVGGLSAAGLLFCGVPAWLALGFLIGALELIPYVGPVIGGVLTALFALPGGLGRMLWALGVIIAVQQMDGSYLSPRLLSETTRLHPVVVILCVVLGGAAAGVAGVLLSAPLVLCVRAALRVSVQYVNNP